VKQHSEIQSFVLGWIENTLDARQREMVGKHLEICSSCRMYYSTISRVILPQADQNDPRLVPDPYLLTRIRAIAGEGQKSNVPHLQQALRWTLRTAMFVLAIVLGVTIGERLSASQPRVTDSHIITEYSQSFWDSGIENRWVSIAQVGEEGRQ
jgi:predicted anti-sigma-YlaC factor YlaD